MTIALVVCERCVRHMRVDEPRCPFCGAAVPAVGTQALELPRGASRAVIAALGATLSLGACHGRGEATVDATRAREPQRAESHPLIMAPYGAPPPPRDGLPPAVRDLQWFVTISSPITMGARATTPLEISARNHGAAAVRPQRERLRLRVNGELSPAFDLAFNNGTMLPAWSELPTGQVVRDVRPIVEALMPGPGEYMLALEWDGHVVSRRSVTVRP
ncbi:MAG: hypothetical protein EPO40_05770 [Myxococcaceae bacterium]|nr:MAG: hypothetical protein EPO40_05770 [Myxococcaceae bacterium]